MTGKSPAVCFLPGLFAVIYLALSGQRGVTYRYFCQKHVLEKKIWLSIFSFLKFPISVQYRAGVLLADVSTFYSFAITGS